MNNDDLLAKIGQQQEETEFYTPMPQGYRKGHHKYVVVVGTVMSGLGKGIFSSSLAKLIQDKGMKVAPIKMEGYLNIDSGTLNPYRHGEVFVLDDGMECDMDLGTYERLLDQDLSAANFTTNGQILSGVLKKEREGGYLGRDVQVIPHVVGEVKLKLRELAAKSNADVIFVEVGGTVGDYENAFYLEACRQLAYEEGEGSVAFVVLTYVLEPGALGEQKSKAAQLGIKRLMEVGIMPHIIAVRAANPVKEKVREKISMYTNVPMKRVMSMHDVESIYIVPEMLREAGMDREVLTLLDLHDRVNQRSEDRERQKWKWFVDRIGKEDKNVTIAVTGKYTALRDAYASIIKAGEHCSVHLGVNVNFKWIDTGTVEPASVASLTVWKQPSNGAIRLLKGGSDGVLVGGTVDLGTTAAVDVTVAATPGGTTDRVSTTYAPGTEMTVYVVTGNRLFRSTDQGATSEKDLRLNQSATAVYHSIVVHPANQQRLYSIGTPGVFRLELP